VEGVVRLPRSLGNFSVSAYARLSEDVVGARRVLDSHVRLFSALLLVPAAVFVAAGGGIVVTLFGGGFTPAVTTLQLLSMAMVPIGVSFALASSGVGTGELRLPIPLVLAILAMQIAAGVTGGLIVSIAGVAAAHLATWCVALTVYVAQSRRRRVPLDLATVVRVVAVALPVFVLSFVVSHIPLALPAQAAIAAIAAAAGCLFFILEPPEWRIVRRVVLGSRP
jgi:O-antigen/teichoic acid export membrane protein